jgi:hypothetical protein
VLYFACLFCYIPFSRTPDYFQGEYIQGVVTKADFSLINNEPELVVDYRVGSETLQYKTTMWFLTSYKIGKKVTIIYNPSDPSEACIYSLVGYWIKWPELFISTFLFTAFFIASIYIAGNNYIVPATEEEKGRKRKYKD